jgi:hypothetical protein
MEFENAVKLMPKAKYLQAQTAGFKSKSSNSQPKKKTIWKLLQENAKRRGK